MLFVFYLFVLLCVVCVVVVCLFCVLFVLLLSFVVVVRVVFVVVVRVGGVVVGLDHPKISLFFFSLPPEISFFLLSLGGLLAEFWWCF